MVLSSQAAWIRAQVTHVHRCTRCGGYEQCVFPCARSPLLAAIFGLWQAAPELCEACKVRTR
jgi:hypothetical protein